MQQRQKQHVLYWQKQTQTDLGFMLCVCGSCIHEDKLVPLHTYDTRIDLSTRQPLHMSQAVASAAINGVFASDALYMLGTLDVPRLPSNILASAAQQYAVTGYSLAMLVRYPRRARAMLTPAATARAATAASAIQ